ncbi:uncharacterized protein LOC122802271 [Protopterus annectens]|uniref:uncharacterized protein LOC122802271 n=1 Tax=Protopterus annectens TaxID=7888 RepID=UPI001CFA0E86|nr:uncharacterized protein LOC122802271 [Protopterus annectens]
MDAPEVRKESTGCLCIIRYFCQYIAELYCRHLSQHRFTKSSLCSGGSSVDLEERACLVYCRHLSQHRFTKSSLCSGGSSVDLEERACLVYCRHLSQHRFTKSSLCSGGSSVDLEERACLVYCRHLSQHRFTKSSLCSGGSSVDLEERACLVYCRHLSQHRFTKSSLCSGGSSVDLEERACLVYCRHLSQHRFTKSSLCSGGSSVDLEERACLVYCRHLSQHRFTKSSLCSGGSSVDLEERACLVYCRHLSQHRFTKSSLCSGGSSVDLEERACLVYCRHLSQHRFTKSSLCSGGSSVDLEERACLGHVIGWDQMAEIQTLQQRWVDIISQPEDLFWDLPNIETLVLVEKGQASWKRKQPANCKQVARGKGAHHLQSRGIVPMEAASVGTVHAAPAEGNSFNDFISVDNVKVHYASLDNMVQIIRGFKDPWLVKVDIESAFRLLQQHNILPNHNGMACQPPTDGSSRPPPPVLETHSTSGFQPDIAALMPPSTLPAPSPAGSLAVQDGTVVPAGSKGDAFVTFQELAEFVG